MKGLKTHQAVTSKEVQDLISKHDSKKQGGLEFEDFLRVPLKTFLFFLRFLKGQFVADAQFQMFRLVKLMCLVSFYSVLSDL